MRVAFRSAQLSRRPCLVRSCAREQGPITIGVRRRQERSSSFPPREYSWLWVPDRGSLVRDNGSGKPPHSRGAMRPRFEKSSLGPPCRGRRECRALDAPAASHACEKQSIRVSHHGHTGFTRHSPRNGFNGFLRALPGVPGLLATVVGRNKSADLTPASGCRDHTTSPSATRAVRYRHNRVHRIPLPTSVTIAKRPSCGSGMSEDIRLIC